MVAEELETIQLYTQLAESTDNKRALKALKDIAGGSQAMKEFLIIIIVLIVWFVLQAYILPKFGFRT